MFRICRGSLHAGRCLDWRPVMAVGVLGLLLGTWSPAPAADASGVGPTPPAASPRVESVPAGALRQWIEDDWLQSIAEPLSTRSDAAGAVDGVKDGKYAFHTWLEPNPWWQVDLGQPTPISRIVV
mgnify:CR=1 FL=1